MSQAVSVCEGKFTQITVCAGNLPAGAVVSVTSGSRETKSQDSCVFEAEKFNFSDVQRHDVTVRLDDNRGCPVKEEFVLHVLENDCRTTLAPTLASTTATTITTTASTSSTTPVPTNCAAVSSSQKYQVMTYPNSMSVVCDTQTDGGGWVVFQRRQVGNVIFSRNWADYRAGFGDFSGDFWLGLEKVHILCGNTQSRCELRIDMKHSNGSSYYVNYAQFYIGDDADQYTLHVGGYTGDGGDALITEGYSSNNHIANGQKFSTPDRDNDNNVGFSCASGYPGGWWYNHCLETNLNGIWGGTDNFQGVTWYPVTGSYSSLIFSEMKL